MYGRTGTLVTVAAAMLNLSRLCRARRLRRNVARLVAAAFILALVYGLALLLGSQVRRYLRLSSTIFGRHDPCVNEGGRSLAMILTSGRQPGPKYNCSAADKGTDACVCPASVNWPAGAAGEWVSVPCGFRRTAAAGGSADLNVTAEAAVGPALESSLAAGAGRRLRRCGVARDGRAQWDTDTAGYEQAGGAAPAVPARMRAQCRLVDPADGGDVRVVMASGDRRHTAAERLIADCPHPPVHPDLLPPAASRPNASGRWLPGGVRCFVHALSAIGDVQVEASALSAVVFHASRLPELPAGGLLGDGDGRPRFELPGAVPVGVMSMEPASYFPILSAGCQRSHKSLFHMTPSLEAAVPLPYFSWEQHPLGLAALPDSGSTGRGREGKQAAAGGGPAAAVPSSGEAAFGGALDRDLSGRLPAVFIASNCKANNWRLPLVKRLMKQMGSSQLHSIGECGRNQPWPVVDGAPLSLRAAIARYSFYLAFENSNEPGYVTEKVYNGLDAGAIPVYLGAPDVGEYVPAGSVIDLRTAFRHEFQTLEKHWRAGGSRLGAAELGGALSTALDRLAASLATELVHLWSRPFKLKEEYQHWRQQWPTRAACAADAACMARLSPMLRSSADCRLCAAAYAMRRRRPPPPPPEPRSDGGADPAKPLPPPPLPRAVWDQPRQMLVPGHL
eukprot:SAG22_NODE_197_length_15520_cov_116.311264_6_plen_675_part_00